MKFGVREIANVVFKAKADTVIGNSTFKVVSDDNFCKICFVFILQNYGKENKFDNAFYGCC